MLDFSSALYLGLEHSSASLPQWKRLTLGKPAALKVPPGSREVERQLAALMGCERALLLTSTLHLFLDLFVVLARCKANIFMDASCYPIVRWGVERAACSGARVRLFPRHDVNAVKRALEKADGRPPIIVADGYCPGCGKLAPLAEYLHLAEEYGGFVVIDDSQPLGIFGVRRTGPPYGTGGGGSLRHAGLSSGRLLVGASLAKGFGVPVAVLAGSAATVGEFERHSATRVHCSPPSAAVISATARALAINHECGDELRLKLGRLVTRFRNGLKKLRVGALPGLFPMQTLRLPRNLEPELVHQRLKEAGVESVLHREAHRQKLEVSFIMTAQHSVTQVDRALEDLQDAIA